MREWKKPEVKIFDVKMDENIAASGDGSGYLSDYFWFSNGVISRGGGWYKYNASNQVQDTSYVWEMYGDKKVVTKYGDDWQDSIQSDLYGCLA